LVDSLEEINDKKAGSSHQSKAETKKMLGCEGTTT
jgi:hypothetical protein